MVAADRKRDHGRIRDPAIAGLDIGVTIGQAVSASHRHVADISDPQRAHRRHPQHMFVRSDTLDPAHGARSQTGASPVGHSEIHRDPDQGDVQGAESLVRQAVGPKRRVDEGRRAGEWPFASVGIGEDLSGHGLEMRVVHVAARRRRVAPTQFVQLRDVISHVGPSSVRGMIGGRHFLAPAPRIKSALNGRGGRRKILQGP